MINLKKSYSAKEDGNMLELVFFFWSLSFIYLCIMFTYVE